MEIFQRFDIANLTNFVKQNKTLNKTNQTNKMEIFKDFMP